MSLPLEAPPPSRSPWQRFYALAHRLRRRWYATRAHRLPVPVVSIGNLSWGGSGKTPLTAALAAHLRDSGWRVAILSRGYGSRGEGVRVVSRGEGPLLDPLVAGDEPVLLAGELPGVAVVVGPDRHVAGLHALERLEPAPELFLLDDGFSHLRLARDLDLLAFPAADPFGGGRLLPSGRLREPLEAAARADAVLLTGAPESGDPGGELARALRLHGFGGPGFAVRTRAGAVRRIPSSKIDAGARVLVVSAIARPEQFLETARRQSIEVAGELRFPDHHRYPPASLEKIRAAFVASKATVVLTTGKDRVKLQDRLELPIAELPIVAEPEPAFFRWLDGRLGELTGRREGST